LVENSSQKLLIPQHVQIAMLTRKKAFHSVESHHLILVIEVK
jgi:hypothetical protein